MLHPQIFGNRNPCPRGDFLTIIAIQKSEERPNLPAAPSKKVGFFVWPRENHRHFDAGSMDQIYPYHTM
jgi:hypothetical protein